MLRVDLPAWITLKYEGEKVSKAGYDHNSFGNPDDCLVRSVDAYSV